MAAETKYKLIYFEDNHFVRCVRKMFEYVKKSVEDVVVNENERSLHTSRTPWGCLPILEVVRDEEVNHIGKELSILRFVAKCHGLYPDDNPLEAALIDDCAYAIHELWKEWDETQEDATFTSNILRERFEVLSKVQFCGVSTTDQDSSEECFLLGSRLTLPDIMLSAFLEAVEEKLGEGIINSYPIIMAINDSVRSVMNETQL